MWVFVPEEMGMDGATIFNMNRAEQIRPDFSEYSGDPYYEIWLHRGVEDENPLRLALYNCNNDSKAAREMRDYELFKLYCALATARVFKMDTEAELIPEMKRLKKSIKLDKETREAMHHE